MVDNESDANGQRYERSRSDWVLWWIAMSIIVAGAMYMAASPNTVAFVMAVLLGSVVVLLNLDRLAKAEEVNIVRRSLVFGVAVFGTLTVVHLVGVATSHPI